MKAIVQDRYGPPEVLYLADVDKPVAADHEVLIRVHAAAVNAYDWHMMRGDPYLARLMSPAMSAFGGPKTKIRGRDFAGTVEAVGKNVTRFQPGDEVFGDAGDDGGAFAEYLCIAANLVEPKPANLTFEQAASVPLAGNTALMGVRDCGQLRPGQQILINGCSGGVGTFAVQIAAALGADVTGVCKTANVDLIQSLGAKHVIDYTHEDFTRTERRYDVVFDLVGNRSLTELRRTLTPGGTLVLSGGGTFKGGSLVGPIALMVRGTVTSRLVRQRLLVLQVIQSAENLATLRELIESNKIAPVIDQTFPLSGVPEAVRRLEVEHPRAKITITI